MSGLGSPPGNKETKMTRSSGIRAIAPFLFFTLFFPIAFIFLLVPILGQCITYQVRKQLLRRENAENFLRMETVLALVALPVIGLIGTVGTSWAFYLWSVALTDSSARYCMGALCGGPSAAGKVVLTVTIILCLCAVGISARLLGGHVSGRRVFPFQSDADPTAALQVIRDGESYSPSEILPNVRRDAQIVAGGRVAKNDYVGGFGVKEARQVLLTRGNVLKTCLAVTWGIVAWLLITTLLSWSDVETWGTRLVVIALFTTLSLVAFIAHEWSFAANIYLDSVRAEFRKQQLEQRIAEVKETCTMRSRLGIDESSTRMVFAEESFSTSLESLSKSTQALGTAASRRSWLLAASVSCLIYLALFRPAVGNKKS